MTTGSRTLRDHLRKALENDALDLSTIEGRECAVEAVMAAITDYVHEMERLPLPGETPIWARTVRSTER